MALELRLQRNVSESTFTKTLALNGVPQNRPVPEIGRVFWRWEDEADMKPQFLVEGVIGFEMVVPFDMKGRDVRLYINGVTSSGKESVLAINDATQYVITAPATPEEEVLSNTLQRLFGFSTVVTTSGISTEAARTTSIPAGTLANVEDMVKVEAYGFFAANANDKVVSLNVDGTDISGLDGAYNDVSWSMDAILIRSGADTIAFGIECVPNAAVAGVLEGEITGVDFEADIPIILSYRSPDNAGDVSARIFTGWKIPAAPLAAAAPDNALTLNGDYLKLNGDYIVFNPTAPNNALALNGDHLQLNSNYIVFNP